MPYPTHLRTPGYRFKDGKLLIFQDSGVMLIRGWEEPLAVCKGDDTWESFVPEFRLIAPYRRRASKPKSSEAAKPRAPVCNQMEFSLWNTGSPPHTSNPSAFKALPLATQRRKAFVAFRFSLPKEIARALEGFRSHQWPLLVLLAHDKRVLDLASANPVLAYAVANWYADYPRSRLDFGRMPQRDLLKLLKLPDSAAVAKLLRKIPPESVEQRSWPILLNALRNPDGPTSKLLSHVPTINLGVMEVILTPQIYGFVTPSLLEEVSMDPAEKYRGAIARMLLDLVAMRTELADMRPVTGIKSVERLRQIHANVGEDYHKLAIMRKDASTFPAPPIPGIDGKIIPLTTQTQLVAEGREQNNCVATYGTSVANRQCYIYRVLHPKRSTLCIRPQTDGNWGISQIETSCNRPVDNATRDFVQQWLEPYQIGV